TSQTQTIGKIWKGITNISPVLIIKDPVVIYVDKSKVPWPFTLLHMAIHLLLRLEYSIRFEPVKIPVRHSFFGHGSGIADPASATDWLTLTQTQHLVLNSGCVGCYRISEFSYLIPVAKLSFKTSVADFPRI